MTQNAEYMGRYWLTTSVNGRNIDFMKPMADPFHHTTLVTHWNWRDRLRILIGKPTTVTVNVGGVREAVNAVMDLEAPHIGSSETAGAIVAGGAPGGGQTAQSVENPNGSPGLADG